VKASPSAEARPEYIKGKKNPEKDFGARSSGQSEAIHVGPSSNAGTNTRARCSAALGSGDRGESGGGGVSFCGGLLTPREALRRFERLGTCGCCGAGCCCTGCCWPDCCCCTGSCCVGCCSCSGESMLKENSAHTRALVRASCGGTRSVGRTRYGCTNIYHQGD
jgi:hypothetical protein